RPFDLLILPILVAGVAAIDAAHLVGQPAVDPRVPGIALIARSLRVLGRREHIGVIDPPDRALAEAGDGLGPELVAVAGQGGDVDRPAAQRPEAAVAGLIAQVGVGIDGAGEDTLARHLDGVAAVGWAEAIR